MKNLRVVFMGTPEFAVATLGSLLINGYDVAGVVTAPDKPAGRGRKITKSPVKIFAESHYLPLKQPDSLKDPSFIDWLARMNPDVFVVVGFRMLPETVWKIPGTVTINLHASLLPQYRGAAPINHVIINGETVTGVTTFIINDKIDTGYILLREEIRICPFENAGELHDRLMKHGARLVIKTLQGLAENKLKPKPQSQFMLPGEILKTAPKIFPEDCIINWNDDTQKIHNLIRGLAPHPGARTLLIKKSSSLTFKVFESQIENAEHTLIPGQIVSDGKTFIKVACKSGFIIILQLQPEGKKKMSSQEFLNGFRISDYSISVN
jgi:methionyl-tRNA formyltransferase